MLRIEPMRDDDWPALWQLLRPVFRAGDTYAFPQDMGQADAHRAWVELPRATYVARTTTAHR